MRTGADYRQSLRDGRRVWVMGEGQVEDVTTHPATHAMVEEYAAWYDRHLDPAARQMASRSLGGGALLRSLWAVGVDWRACPRRAVSSFTARPSPYGENALGRVTFTADGRIMSVVCDGQRELPVGASRQYNSCCGNYTYDGTRLVTRVDAASDPSRIGSDQWLPTRANSARRSRLLSGCEEAISGFMIFRANPHMYRRSVAAHRDGPPSVV